MDLLNNLIKMSKLQKLIQRLSLPRTYIQRRALDDLQLWWYPLSCTSAYLASGRCAILRHNNTAQPPVALRADEDGRTIGRGAGENGGSAREGQP